jgi:hypothetical protein
MEKTRIHGGGKNLSLLACGRLKGLVLGFCSLTHYSLFIAAPGFYIIGI